MVKSVLAQSLQVSAYKHDMLDDFLSHVNINMVSTLFFARSSWRARALHSRT